METLTLAASWLALALVCFSIVIGLARLFAGPSQPRTVNRGADKPYTPALPSKPGPGLCVPTEDYEYHKARGTMR